MIKSEMSISVAQPDTRPGATGDVWIRRVFLLALAVVAILYVIRITVPVLTTTRIPDDFRQHYVWMVQAHEGLFFANDPLTQYSWCFQPPAFAAIYSLAARWAEPILFTRIVSFVLVGAFAGFCYLVGERLAPGTAAVPMLAILALVDVGWTRTIMGAFSRSYAPALAAAVVWALLARKRFAIVLILALAGLLHPQSMALGATLVAAVMTIRLWRHGLRDLSRSDFLACGVGLIVVASLSVLASSHMRDMQQRFGPFLSRADVFSMPEYQPGGRFENSLPRILPVDAGIVFGKHFRLHRFVPTSAIQAVVPWARAVDLRAVAGPILLLIVLEVLRRLSGTRLRDMPPVLFLMVLVGCIWNGIAFVVVPRLYFPSRFIAVYLPLAAEMAFALFLARWILRAQAGIRPWLAGAPVLLFVFLAYFGVQPWGGNLPSHPVETRPYRGVASFLRGEPIDTVFAANPKGDADTLLALVPRQTFIARELSHPLFKAFLRDVAQRRTPLVLHALFPRRPSDDVEALRKEGVDLLVLRKSLLADPGLPADVADEPYLSELKSYWSEDGFILRRDFWAAHQDARVYEDADFDVFDLRKLRNDGQQGGKP